MQYYFAIQIMHLLYSCLITICSFFVNHVADKSINNIIKIHTIINNHIHSKGTFGFTFPPHPCEVPLDRDKEE